MFKIIPRVESACRAFTMVGGGIITVGRGISSASTLRKYVDRLSQFNQKEQRRLGRKLRKDELIMEAERISPEFRNKTSEAQRKMIERLLLKHSFLFREIRTRQNKSQKILPCCGMNCVNRCRKGDRCIHKRIINKQHKKVVKKKNNKGYCLIVEEDCKKGDFIIVYLGKKAEKGRNENYWMQLGRRTIDGMVPGNHAKFINHSCEPNCMADKWDVDGEDRAVIMALKNIKPGTELTFDYGWTVTEVSSKTPCLCGSKKCRQYIEK